MIASRCRAHPGAWQMEKRPGIDITLDMIERIGQQLDAHGDEPDEEEVWKKALFPPVIELSVAQYHLTQQRGFVLAHQLVSPYGFYYVTPPDVDEALTDASAQARTAL